MLNLLDMKKILTFLHIIAAVLIAVLAVLALVGEVIGAGNLFEELAKIGITQGVFYTTLLISVLIFLLTNVIGSKFYGENKK
jgi:Na+/pantothenate symporter